MNCFRRLEFSCERAKDFVEVLNFWIERWHLSSEKARNRFADYPVIEDALITGSYWPLTRRTEPILVCREHAETRQYFRDFHGQLVEPDAKRKATSPWIVSEKRIAAMLLLSFFFQRQSVPMRKPFFSFFPVSTPQAASQIRAHISSIYAFCFAGLVLPTVRFSVDTGDSCDKRHTWYSLVLRLFLPVTNATAHLLGFASKAFFPFEIQQSTNLSAWTS